MRTHPSDITIDDNLARIKATLREARFKTLISSDPEVVLRSDYSKLVIELLTYKLCSRDDVRVIIDSFTDDEFDSFARHIIFTYEFNMN